MCVHTYVVSVLLCVHVGMYTHLSPYSQVKSEHTYVISILCVHVGVCIYMHTLPVYAFLI